jgi:N-acetylornithine carbamoyltransferase
MYSKILHKKDFLKLMDFDYYQFQSLFNLAIKLKDEHKHAIYKKHLDSKTLFLIFYNKSLRTRNSFECAMTQLGGHANYLDADKIYTPILSGNKTDYSNESIIDVANVLSLMGHGIAIRIFGDPVNNVIGKGFEIVDEFSKYSKVPVINMECDRFHPCQAMADLFTIYETYKRFRGLTLCLSWAYSPSVKKPISVPQSVLVGAIKCGMNVILTHPKGFELEDDIIKYCAKEAQKNNSNFTLSNNLNSSLIEADIVYAKSWTSKMYFPPINKTIDLKNIQDLFNKNRNWIITEPSFKLCRPNAKYMHCMPIDRNFEVSDDVLNGPNSLIYQEAENRLHIQKAILLDLLSDLSTIEMNT